MISNRWTISIAGADAVTLASLGATAVSLTRVNLDEATLAFALPRSTAGLVAGPGSGLAFGAALTLYFDGAVRWRGTVRRVAADWSGTSARWRITAHDVWWSLKRTLYQQPFALKDEAFEEFECPANSTKVTLGQDAWGHSRTAEDQFEQAVRYATIFLPGEISTTGGSFAAIGQLPIEETRDLTIADVLRRQAIWGSNTVATLSHASAAAVLSLALRTGLAAVALDLDDADLLVDVSGLEQRHDLALRGIALTFTTTELNDDDGQRYTRTFKQTAGALTGPNVLKVTLDLGPDAEEPAGVAAIYYSHMSHAPWAGQLVLVERECSGTITIGKKINLLNGHADWATMGAVVQQVVENLDDGTTTITCGAPEQLGPQDFMARLALFRNRPRPQGFARVQHNGDAGLPECTNDETGLGGGGGGEGAAGDAGGGANPDNPGGFGDPGEANSSAGQSGSIGGQSFNTADVPYCADGERRTVKVLTP